MLASFTGGIYLQGIVTLRNFKVVSPEAEAIDAELAAMKDGAPEDFYTLISRLKECGGLQRIDHRKNLVVTAGRTAIADVLGNGGTYTGVINYGALGTDNTSPAAGDTTLGTEVFRKAPANRTVGTATTTIDFYFSKGDTTGTYEEFGTFIDGTSTTDSGQLFNRLLTGGWTKSSTEAMTVSLQIDVNAS